MAGADTAKALAYSLKRWTELVRFTDDGQLPIDNNCIENQIRAVALERSNWLLAGWLAAQQCITWFMRQVSELGE
ncbi:IS66 family transposase [Pectobacterium actinidiae]|uniref:IS66 family transposase n=1 Tax=Pectobacterium actinidiae TaxID=1507808 RepID=UPI003824A274